MIKHSFLLCIAFLLFFTASSAQYYNTGQDPGSLKWMQIKTGRFTVIYPKTYGDAGKEFARSLDDAYSRLTSLYPEKKFRIPVIIHNYTTESNGYVAWAPSRMEIYPTPEQNSIPLDPNTQLAIHELTHVLQMESLNKGFTKAMSYITGQQFPGIVSSLLPLWFLEGDAVFSESVLTESGRGRSPSFQKQLKALMIEKGNVYKYDKIVNGSFRDFVPDHYQTGYQMMAWSYAKYDPAMWKKALNFTAEAPFTINPVNLSLAKTASLTKKKLFRETFDTLRTLWISDYLRSGSESYETLNPPKRNEYISYHSPVLVGSDTIIAIKTSLSYPASFVLIRPSEKTEKRIHIPGDCYPWFISSGGGKLCWIETHSDPRWENRTWSVIKIMDLKQKAVRQLSKKTRYMSASISPDGNHVAAAENRIDNNNRLVILDARNGFPLESIPVPGNASLQRPQWDASGKIISVIYLTEKGEGIMSYSLKDKTWQTLIEAGNNDLQSSFLRNDSLFFVSSYSGTDNVYLCKPDRSVVPITRSKFGVSDLNLNGYLLLFSNYSSSGNNICYTTLPTGTIDSGIIKSKSSYLINRFKSSTPSPRSYSDLVYEPVQYRKWQHLFRFHSWMPFYADIEAFQDDPLSITPGFTLMTQNNLSTLVSSFGYEYSGNRHKFHSSIKWLGWYLIFETRMDFGNYPYFEKFNETVADPVDITNGYELTNTVYLPLIFRGGRFTKYLYLSASSMFKNDQIYLRSKGAYDAGQNQFTGRFYFSNYHRSARRDIYPRWAQLIDVSYSFYPFDREIYGDIITARTAFYFPGFLKNNGFKLRLEAETQNPEKYILGNRASFSRSYDRIVSEEIQFGSIDYFMPLVYPDFNISSLLYLTRIRSDFFYDFTRGTGNYIFNTGIFSNEPTIEIHDYSEIFKSFGIQLIADFYLFRMPFLISAGVQASWQRFGYYPDLELLFSIDLFGMSIVRKHL
jgi:hypothetical protein